MLVDRAYSKHKKILKKEDFIVFLNAAMAT